MSFISDVTKSVTKIGDVIKKTYGPLSALETDFISKDVLRYPLDVGDSRMYPHTVEFQTWIPTPTTIGDLEPIQKIQDGISGLASKLVPDSVKQMAGSVGNKVTNAINNSSTAASLGISIDTNSDLQPIDTSGTMRVNYNQRLNDRMFDFIRRATRSDLIAMYLPVSWMDQQNNSYNEKSMTDAFGAIGGVLEAGGSIAKAMQDWKDLGGAVNQIMKQVNGPAGMEVLGAAAGAVGMDGSIVRDVGLNAIGYAMNPQFEILYGGTSMREFQFDFVMTPRSEKESYMVREVVNKFKYHASPQFQPNQGRYICPPSYFDITFKFNGNNNLWLPLVSTCVLRSVSVNYTGDMEQWAAHEDGSPVQVKMTLMFVELEMMHKALRAQGY